ncbi:SDR family oxidoreductase [Novosphingobium kaempferiae]|uniref:SDR family oxidoreductase n=1 Tax=Novosphingobium kaempferiae TaxID=2896849 RepID=UPI001E5B4550|nr:SDR family oxidoreductase [Novosphingobium kaempferiae]
MRVFLTGATGFIGAKVAQELIRAGHQVLGMTRSDSGAKALAMMGAEVHRAELGDLDAMRAGAAQADAVIHTAFDHDFSRYVANCEQDRRVIGALGAELKGSARPLIITSAVGIGERGNSEPAIEAVLNLDHPVPRIASELAGNDVLASGVDVRVVRLPQVHDDVKQGLVTPYVALCREKEMVAFVEEGANRWSAAPVADVARLFRLAMERGQAGERYNAVAEEGVPFHQIAKAVGRGLGKPVVSIPTEEAPSYFGWFAMFASLDMSASSAWTRSRLGWESTGPDLLDDIARMSFFLP